MISYFIPIEEYILFLEFCELIKKEDIKIIWEKLKNKQNE